MNSQFRFGILFCVLIVIGVLFAGCSNEDSSDAVVTTAPTTAPAAKYTAGDIIAKTDTGSESQLYVILGYNAGTDEYERAWIYKNTDGTWGHFVDSRTDKSTRTIIEKVYPVRVAHVTVSNIPVVTPTVATAVPTTSSGNGPTVTAITPTSGAKDGTVSVTIAGTNFLTGATAKLLQPGSSAITATGVSIGATKIDCTFNLYGKDAGTYNVVVTNPDGQSDTLQRAFIIGDAAPVISSVSPTILGINEQIGLIINGQNFKEGVKVVLVKGSGEIPCVSPVSTSGSRITCDLDLNAKRNKAVAEGEWDVKVINIEGSQSGIWTKKFTIQNTTTTDDEDDT